MPLWFRKFHGWIALGFALPLLGIIGSGLILSFEPWLVTRSIEPATLTPAKVEALLKQHDPEGKARTLTHRSYDGTLSISAGRRGGTVVNTNSSEVQTALSKLAETLGTVRRFHEHLILEEGELVTASTIAMLVLIVLGALMGWPKFSNNLAGWHKGIAWIGLPLILLSPLTGLLLAQSVSLAGAPPAAADAAKPATMIEAVRIVGAKHDLSGLVWLRSRGDRLLARIVEDGEYRVYAVTQQGTVAMPRNWPRLWHEGNFAGAWSALMNVIVSAAMLTLLVTGLWIWFSRRQRLRARRSA